MSDRPDRGADPWPLVLALGILTLYATVVDNPLVYDDVRTVVANPSLSDPNNWRFALLYERFRPLTNLSHYLEVHLLGGSATVFHLTNVALHVLASIQFYFLLRKISAAQGRFVPRVASAVFACHPLATSTVAYVSARSELLVWNFLLGALLLFCRFAHDGQRRWPIAGSLAWLGALLSKESAAVFPALLFGLSRLGFSKSGGNAGAVRLQRAATITFGLVVLAAFLRILVFFRRETGQSALGYFEHLLLQARLFWRYLWLASGLAQQSFVQSVETNVGAIDAVALLALVSLLVACVRARRGRVARFATLSIPVALAPSALIPLAEPMAEHRAYGALFGVAILFALGIEWLAGRIGAPGRKEWVSAALAGAVIAGLVGHAAYRLVAWNSEAGLWVDAANQAPRVFLAQAAAGEALHRNGRCAEALPFYEAALELTPGETTMGVNIGACMAALGRYQDAEAVLGAVVEAEPTNSRALANLAKLATLRGDGERAKALWSRVLELNPSDRRAEEALRALP